MVVLFPQGVPEDAATQEILKWQFRTQYMMNKMVFDAIHETYGGVGGGWGGSAGVGGKGGMGEGCPRVEDYLNFYCLGNREGIEGSEVFPFFFGFIYFLIFLIPFLSRPYRPNALLLTSQNPPKMTLYYKKVVVLVCTFTLN